MELFLDGGHFKNYSYLRDFFDGSLDLVLLTDGKKSKNYQKEWKNCFREDLKIINPKNKDDIDFDLIKKSDGILIGGGCIKLYDKYYNNKRIKNILKTKKKIFGTSAGAMLLGEYFWYKGIYIKKYGKKIKLSEKMNNYTGRFEIKKGLGLLSDKVLGAHIKEYDEEKATKQVMLDSGIQKAIGLDENTHALIRNNEYIKKYGDGNIYFY